MGGTTTSNGRDGEMAWVEGLLTGAGASIGRVLDERQVHAVELALEVFAYLLAAMPAERAPVADIIRLLKFYSNGVRNAKSES
jgi:hypothetical protein